MKEKAFVQLGMGPINMSHKKTNNVWNYAQHHQEGPDNYYMSTIFLGCCNYCSSTTVIYVILLLHSSNLLCHAFPTCHGSQIFWPFDPARAWAGCRGDDWSLQLEYWNRHWSSTWPPSSAARLRSSILAPSGPLSQRPQWQRGDIIPLNIKV